MVAAQGRAPARSRGAPFISCFGGDAEPIADAVPPHGRFIGRRVRER